MSAEVPIIDMTATGERIKQLREDKGLTIKELQDTFGFTNPQAIYKWQKGSEYSDRRQPRDSFINPRCADGRNHSNSIGETNEGNKKRHGNTDYF